MYLLRRRAEKLERTNLNYGALARLTRDGGFWIVLVIRLSAIPSHFSTAVFSTCNVKFWHFFVATFLSLPKQIFLVYLGVLLVQEKSSNAIQTVMFGAVFVVTIVLGVYIWMKMRKIKNLLLEEQAQRREKRMQEELAAEDKAVAERRAAEEVDEPAPAYPQQSWRQQEDSWRQPEKSWRTQEQSWRQPEQTWGAPPPGQQNWVPTPGRAF